ncbi:hypothetical protein B0H12DRAFT_1155010 [Mycena haematopus]|nr:hypothetical protein B0H12DRAFT_1155010 [Mycena haematopus]
MGARKEAGGGGQGTCKGEWIRRWVAGVLGVSLRNTVALYIGRWCVQGDLKNAGDLGASRPGDLTLGKYHRTKENIFGYVVCACTECVEERVEDQRAQSKEVGDAEVMEVEADQRERRAGVSGVMSYR